MPRIKYIYSVYDYQKKSHIAFFSSLDRALEFCLAHNIEVDTEWQYWNKKEGPKYTGKKDGYDYFNPTNFYSIRFGFTHLFVKIPLDQNGRLPL